MGMSQYNYSRSNLSTLTTTHAYAQVDSVIFYTSLMMITTRNLINCHQMHDLLLENSSDIRSSEYKRNFYNQFLPTIFDRKDINSKEHLFAIPMCCKKHEKDNNTQRSP